METSEHIEAGNLIKVESKIAEGNDYIHVEGIGSEATLSKLTVFTTPDDDGIPQPLNLELSPGEIVAMAGDYYTKAGWASTFQLPEPCLSDSMQRRALVMTGVNRQEKEAFIGAYKDLANDKVSQKDIDNIERVDRASSQLTTFFENTFSFFRAPIGLASKLITQAYFALSVSDYSEKLDKNEAHFAPWSTRAYVIGHQQALEYAELAKAFAYYPDFNNSDATRIFDKACKTETFRGQKPEEISQELSRRYLALAYATDLFTMHFYSDNYAGGHNMRIGRMRQILPKRHGIWGSILVNTMHDFDNANGVWVNNPFQPERLEGQDNQAGQFNYPDSDDQAFGDGHYVNQKNWGNRDELVNGMTNSLGDITRVAIEHEDKPTAANFGGLPFLADLDKRYIQYQPLMIQGANGKIYYRNDPTKIKSLTPSEYDLLQKQPEKNTDYEELTTFRAIKLVIKLRVLSVIPIIGKYFALDQSKNEAVEQSTIHKPDTYYSLTHKIGSKGDVRMRNKRDSTPNSEVDIQASVLEEVLPQEIKHGSEGHDEHHDSDYRLNL